MGCRIHDRRCHRLLQSLRVPTNDFPDYPKFGVGPDAYYFTFDNFNITGSTDLGGNVCAADRTKMLAGTKATMQCSEQNAQQFARVPADLDGANPPAAGTPNFMMELDPDGSARFPPLRRYAPPDRVDDAFPGPPQEATCWSLWANGLCTAWYTETLAITRHFSAATPLRPARGFFIRGMSPVKSISTLLQAPERNDFPLPSFETDV
jgi:hypothetical protein